MNYILGVTLDSASDCQTNELYRTPNPRSLTR